MSGTLYGVGVGPGDPELLTLKAYRLIRDTRTIAYPAPDTGESFARSICAALLDGAAKDEVPIVVPMRPERWPAQDVYDRATRDLAARLDEGHDVVVLCEGDPFFFGSFMYLFARLADRYRTRIVPGVSSLTAAAAVAHRPLAERNDTLGVVPATLEDGALREALAAPHSLAIIKVGRHLGRLRRALEDIGRLERAVLCERVTLPEQRIVALADDTRDAAPYFSIVLCR